MRYVYVWTRRSKRAPESSARALIERLVPLGDSNDPNSVLRPPQLHKDPASDHRNSRPSVRLLSHTHFLSGSAQLTSDREGNDRPSAVCLSETSHTNFITPSIVRDTWAHAGGPPTPAAPICVICKSPTRMGDKQ